MASTGPAGTMGPPTQGKYNAEDPTVLSHIAAALKSVLAARGITATVTCTGDSPSQATCGIIASNGKTESVVVAVDQTTGKLTIVKVTPGGQMASSGPAGTMGPPTQGKYDATNPTVLSHIEDALKSYLAAHGVQGATASCKGDSPSQATCTLSASGKTETVTVAVNQTTGKLTIVKVTHG